MNVLVCVKRVPATGGKVSLTPDEQEIDTRFLGFAVSPHEECAVEEAVRQVEAHGGSSLVLSLGPEAAVEQLRDAMAIGVDRAILLDSCGQEWDPAATAAAIADVARAQDPPFDLLLFGNEAADSGDYQVGIRVAHALDLPCITGAKELKIENGVATVRREAAGGWEVYQLPLPAVVTVQEGINLPRYASMPGRLKAKKKPLERAQPGPRPAGLEKIRLKLPPEQAGQAEVLGQGPEAAGRAVEILQRLGVLKS